MNEVRFARAAQSEPLHEPETLAHEHVRPGIVVGKVLRHDAFPPPENLLEDPGLRLGTDPIPAYRYFSKDYAQLEKEKLWPKVWQFSCWGQDIPNAGDIHVFVCDPLTAYADR